MWFHGLGKLRLASRMYLRSAVCAYLYVNKLTCSVDCGVIGILRRGVCGTEIGKHVSVPRLA